MGSAPTPYSIGLGSALDPVFTLPYSEFCVAQQLSRHLPSRDGYSIYAPLSRQQPGVDLMLARRRRRSVRVACIQVKSSRTYSHPGSGSRAKRKFRYYTWFNTFTCPPQADFFCLVSLYPAVDAAQRRELGSWWAPQVLVFSQAEMKRFLGRVRTVSGGADPMFGFGFDEANHAFQTRGDSARRFREYSDHLLPNRLRVLQRFLSRGG
jgi:hypothetical protein